LTKLVGTSCEEGGFEVALNNNGALVLSIFFIRNLPPFRRTRKQAQF
jgi:hypothetical protein